MVVSKIIEERKEIHISEATLLSVDEAKALPRDKLIFKKWWWLKPSSDKPNTVSGVSSWGEIFNSSLNIKLDMCAIRPALKITFEPDSFEIGDVFLFGGHYFEIINSDTALCMSGLEGLHFFTANYSREGAFSYERSDVKESVDSWFKSSMMNTWERR